MTDGVTDGMADEIPTEMTGDRDLLEELAFDDGEPREEPLPDAPTAADLAELAAVEAELDTRWGETTIEPSLTRIAALMELLGSPQHSYPVIHVAGTNGKTSVTRMIESLMRALHRRTGRTTSPHLQIATERIAIDGRPITPRRYVDAWNDIRPYVEMIDARSEEAGGPRMSKFEVLTAMAFTAFADAPVDVAVIETGMGGRWDATNVADGRVAVLTPIGLDHTDYLGPDLRAIAGEKVGIVKRAAEPEIAVEGMPAEDTVVVVGEQETEAMDVVYRAAVEADAAVARLGGEFVVLGRRVAVGGQQLVLRGLGGVYEDIFLPLHGEHQAANAAVALAAVEAFFGAGKDRQLDVDAVREGFATVENPGRLERVRSAPTVFLDAAHNPHGARALARCLTEEFDFRRLVGVVSVMADKDVEGVLRELEPVLDEIVVTHNGSPRAMPAVDLAELAAGILGEERVHTAPGLPDALELAISLAEEVAEPGEAISGSGVVVTGSVVTAGAARGLFGKEPA